MGWKWEGQRRWDAVVGRYSRVVYMYLMVALGGEMRNSFPTGRPSTSHRTDSFISNPLTPF